MPLNTYIYFRAAIRVIVIQKDILFVFIINHLQASICLSSADDFLVVLPFADGRSARGRPRFGWMDGVKRALNDRMIDIREASERARNRNEWRMIVTQF